MCIIALSSIKVGYGEYALSLQRYANEFFEDLAGDSGDVELGDPLYFAVHLTTATNLTFLIESCWATPDSYPLAEQKYTLIEDG